MKIVVSDTSPIRCFEFLGLLHILGDLYEQVLVPPAVVNELQRVTSRFHRVDVSDFAFINVVSPYSDESVEALLSEVDLGEAEALVIAQEQSISGVLMDDAEARQKARELGLNVVGTLGLLVRAKEIGRISQVRPLIDRLRRELQFFVSDELMTIVLKSAGE